MNTHTPMPWRIVKDAQGSMGLMHPTKSGVAVAWFSSTFSPANGYVGEAEHEIGRPEREANIQFIVRACNSHDALLAACRKQIIRGCGCYAVADPDYHSDECAIPQLRAAITLAEKGEIK